MQDWTDKLFFGLQTLLAYVQLQFERREIYEWVLFFFPFTIFGEIPRYILPAVWLFLLKLFRCQPDDLEQRKRFLATKPSVSVLLVGYNEGECVANAIDSLLEFHYPNLEIIVIDDNSTDNMYEVVKPYADKGLVRLFKNAAATGRGGRPSASNFALHLATGEFILSVDADTSFDRDSLLHMIGSFYDPKVGVVAGNLKVRETGQSLLADMQALEYFMSIGLRKRFLNLFGMNVQASGAFGAFRRQALLECGAWDAEIAEDADISLKMKRAGWKISFAPEAVALTSVPPTLRQLNNQRNHWDRGILRNYYHKHGDLLKFWQYDWRNATEMALEYFFSFFLTLFYAAYLVAMLVYDPRLLLFAFAVCYLMNVVFAFIQAGAAIYLSERRAEEWRLLDVVVLWPLYKAWYRVLRFKCIVLEMLRINYEIAYLPASAWRNAPRW